MDAKTKTRIQQAREARGWTQTELADRCNISQQSIARYEAGREPKVSAIISMAGALGVTISYLLGMDDEPVNIGLSLDERKLVDAYRAAGGETRDVMMGIANSVINRNGK